MILMNSRKLPGTDATHYLTGTDKIYFKKVNVQWYEWDGYDWIAVNLSKDLEEHLKPV